MSCSCYEKLMSAGDIQPGATVYRVVFTPDHETLKAGDEVVMRANKDSAHVFVRLKDLTLHPINTARGYVVVTKEAAMEATA